MVAQRIQANYDCLQEMIKLFMRHADMTVALTFQIEGLVDQLQAGAWRGVGAEAFYAEMRDLVLPMMRKLQDTLQFAGEGTGKIHTILREAEEEAARLFRGEGETFKPRRDSQEEVSPQQTPDKCRPNPTEEGQKFVEAAHTAGIDPVLLAMIIKNEWNHKAYEHVFPFIVTQLDSDYSYGVGQIQGINGMEIVQAYPRLFSDYPDLYVNGTLDQGRVEWFLFTDESFNLRVGALLMKNLKAQMIADLLKMGIRVSDTSYTPVNPNRSELPTITRDQFNQLLASAWNQGWRRRDSEGDPKLGDRLEEKYLTSRDRIKAIFDTLKADPHIKNVWNNQSYAEQVVGLSLDCHQ